MRASQFVLNTLAHYARCEEGPPPGVPARVDADFEKRLVAICEAQRVSALVSSSLASLSLPPAVSRVTIARLEQSAADLATDARRRLALAVRLVEQLRDASVDVLLCGEARSAVLYPPGIRHVRGVELLVHERDTARALSILEEGGFRLAHIHPVFGRSRSRGRVSERRAQELLRYHHYFAPLIVRNVEGHAVRLRMRGIDIGQPQETEVAWAHRTRVALPGGDVDAVGDEDHLIDVSVTAGIHGLAELMWLVDIAQMSDRTPVLDWEYLLARARLSRVHSSIRYAMHAACTTFRVPDLSRRLPPAVPLSEPVMDTWFRRQKLDYAALPAVRAGRFVYGLMWTGRGRQRWRWLWHHVTPNRRWIHNRLGAPTFWRWLKFLLVVRDVPAWTPLSAPRAAERDRNVIQLHPRGRQK